MFVVSFDNEAKMCIEIFFDVENALNATALEGDSITKTFYRGTASEFN